jgi:hypothetical protein
VLLITINKKILKTKIMALTKKSSAKNSSSKFQKILASSGQDLLDRRSQLIHNSTAAAMQDVITNLTRKRDSIELEILNLTDLSVNTRNSLRPGNKDYDPNKWVEQMCALQKEIELINDDLDIAEAIQEEYFTVEEDIDVTK